MFARLPSNYSSLSPEERRKARDELRAKRRLASLQDNDLPQPTENTMKKVWIICAPGTVRPQEGAKKYDSLDEAVAMAKRMVGGPNAQYPEMVVYEAVAVVKQPVPEAEVIKIEA